MSAFDSALQRIAARLSRVPQQFENLAVQIGVPGNAQYEDGTKVVGVAVEQEFGAARIPARPFFRPTIKAKKAEWGLILRHYLPAVGAGKATAFDVLDLVGRTAAIDIKEAIAGIHSPPLSPVTVLARELRKTYQAPNRAAAYQMALGMIAKGGKVSELGAQDDKPLNDTGYLIASIGHAVNPNGTPLMETREASA